MREKREASASVDRLFSEILRAGEDAPSIREFLADRVIDEPSMIGLLRRAVPVRFLEQVAGAPPWSERPLVLGAVVLNPRAPRTLALRLLPSLYWRALADVAASPRVASAVRMRAEALLKDMLPQMRLGDRIALGRIATLALLPLLLFDGEPRVARAALANPRLREQDVVVALRQADVPRPLIEEVAASPRWRESYAAKLELALQPRTPLALALAQLSSLLEGDLLRIARAPGLAPLVQAAALRVAKRDDTRS